MKAVVEFWNVIASEKRYVFCDIDFDADCILVADNFMKCINPGTELIFDGHTVFLEESEEPIAIILTIIEAPSYKSDNPKIIWSHFKTKDVLF